MPAAVAYFHRCCQWGKGPIQRPDVLCVVWCAAPGPRKLHQHGAQTVRFGKRVFYRIDGQWLDSAYKKEMKTRRIAFACDDYFKLLDDHPELKPCLALGERIIVVLDGTAILIEVAP